jgi:hypothetical protein
MKRIQKNATTQIRVGRTQYKSIEFVDVRNWVLKNKQNEYVPTRQGITVPTDRIDEIISAFQSCKSSSEDSPDESVK